MPLVDTEVFAQLLHVGDQVLGGVELHVGGRVAHAGCASAASALIEEDDPVTLRIEGLAGACRAPRTGAALHHESGLTVRVAARLP